MPSRVKKKGKPFALQVIRDKRGEGLSSPHGKRVRKGGKLRRSKHNMKRRQGPSISNVEGRTLEYFKEDLKKVTRDKGKRSVSYRRNFAVVPAAVP